MTAPGWREASVWWPTWRDAERVAVDVILPRLAGLEAAGTITAWWWVRKGPEWRIRYRPAPGCSDAMRPFLDALAADGRISRWAATIYEPAVAALGGPAALDVAHELFHADSTHLAGYLAGEASHRREIGLLLIAALQRGAERDWNDQGQVCTLIGDERPAPPPTSQEADSVRLLLTADPSTTAARLAVPTGWFTAFEKAGRSLFDLDRRGVPTRGLGAVLAQHVLFAWNRLGLPAPVQGALAHAAALAVFGPSPTAGPATVNAGAPDRTAAKVGAVTTTDSLQQNPAELRRRLVDRIRGLGTFRTAAVENAFATVPREIFLPGVDLHEAYQAGVVVTKRADDGTALSSASSPNLVAAQAEDLDVRLGHRVLEIGAATGINAALLAELTGPTGHVVTIEIDDDLADSARTALTKAGYGNVTVVCGDGADGWASGGPYDRIIVTAGAWDISRAWWRQLAPGGRIVVPLRLHGSGLTRSLALDLQPSGEMTAGFTRVCGFVPMRGAAAHATTTLRLTDEMYLTADASDEVNGNAIAQALAQPATTHWTGLQVTDHEPVEHLDLWLATTTTGFARLSVSTQARSAGLADPALRWAGASLVDGGTLAYLATRPRGPVSKEIGILAHGPDAEKLTARFADLLTGWNRTRPPRPVITAYPAGTPDHKQAPGVRIDRPDTRLTIAW